MALRRVPAAPARDTAPPGQDTRPSGRRFPPYNLIITISSRGPSSPARPPGAEPGAPSPGPPHPQYPRAGPGRAGGGRRQQRELLPCACCTGSAARRPGRCRGRGDPAARGVTLQSSGTSRVGEGVHPGLHQGSAPQPSPAACARWTPGASHSLCNRSWQALQIFHCTTLVGWWSGLSGALW